MRTCYRWLKSKQVGPVVLVWRDDALVALYTGKNAARCIDPTWQHDPKLDCVATRQLDAYFAGELQDFDLPIALDGTEFQVTVWRALADIPYGETVSYGEMARRVGRPKAVRAVGAANGRNPVSIVLPCHRVIGQDGSLTGYGGGLEVKAALLDFERANVQPALPGLE